MTTTPLGGYEPPQAYVPGELDATPSSGFSDDPLSADRSTSTDGPAGAAAPAKAEVAKDQAAQIGQSAKESGQQVAGTAADEAKNVVRETRRQAKDLGNEINTQVQQQASTQKDKAVGGLHSLGDELRSMATQGGQSGPATDLAHQAADKISDLASWLEQRDPGSLVEEVRNLARHKPGTFLLGAAAVGVVAGRLTRGVVQAGQNEAGGSGADSNAPGSTPAGIDVRGYEATAGYESTGRSL